eukprot:10821136-Alexandrium_andersonii.AAC.1
MDFDNVKGLWMHSLSMGKERRFIPLFKADEDSEEEEDAFMGPEVEVNEDFDDFTAQGDKSEWSDDASMGDSTSPETNYCFVSPGKTD